MPDPVRPRAPTQEIMLDDLAQRLARLREGRLAVKVCLSKLSPAYSRENYLRVATEVFASSVSIFDGQIFVLQNSDIFFVGRGVTMPALDAVVNRLRVLFSEDPLLRLDSSGQSAFCQFFDLETDYDAFSAATRAALGGAEATIRDAQDSFAQPTKDSLKAALSEIQPEQLNKLESSLATTDVSMLTRRQTVCTIIEGQAPIALFDEIFVSIEQLRLVTIPGVDLTSSSWLFRHLTQTLDRRVMQMLIKDGVKAVRPFSLNLNVATVLSPGFMTFESVIAPQLKGRLVIEMNKLDVFSDMGAFLFARDYLHDHGFRLCLDGLTHHTLPYYDREKLGFDLVKIYWTPDSLNEMAIEMMPIVRNIVMETGQAHTILCRCDDAHAVEMGRELGIVMFQGHHVDGLLGQSRQGGKANPS